MLLQVEYLPTYTARHLRRQVAGHLAANHWIFNPIVSMVLDPGETYQDYVESIANGSEWGDIGCLAAISHMWNLTTSIIQKDKIEKLFHQSATEHIAIVFNGVDHYSGTGMGVTMTIYPQYIHYGFMTPRFMYPHIIRYGFITPKTMFMYPQIHPLRIYISAIYPSDSVHGMD